MTKTKLAPFYLGHGVYMTVSIFKKTEFLSVFCRKHVLLISLINFPKATTVNLQKKSFNKHKLIAQQKPSCR